MEEKHIYLVVGLGNPGTAYNMTRHNVGFIVLDEIAEGFSIPFEKKTKYDADVGRGFIEKIESILVKPLSFMNRSGWPVSRIMHYYKIPRDRLLVVHDDIDLDFGRIKIKEKGGDGGHKGIRSLIEVLGGDDFIRLRVGVGRSEKGLSPAEHVLARFSEDEKSILNQVVERSRDAVVAILNKGAKESMNEFNNKKAVTSS